MPRKGSSGRRSPRILDQAEYRRAYIGAPIGGPSAARRRHSQKATASRGRRLPGLEPAEAAAAVYVEQLVDASSRSSGGFSDFRAARASSGGYSDVGRESFWQGVPLWSEVAVPRPKTFNKDGRLHTPDWHRRASLATGGHDARTMLMTPYTAHLHETFINADSESVQRDMRRCSGIRSRAGNQRHTTGGGESSGGFEPSRPMTGLQGSTPSIDRLEPLPTATWETPQQPPPLTPPAAGPDMASLMQENGAYVSNHLVMASNTSTFLAAAAMSAKGSQKRSTSRGTSYRILAGTLLQASFQDQVSVLDREMQKQSYMRHIPHSLEPAMHRAALKFQCGWRGYQAREYMKLLNRSATKIQARYRSMQERRRFKRKREAATQIQSRFRARRARIWYQRVRAAVLTIQCGWRCFIARRVVADKRSTRDGVILLLIGLLSESADSAEAAAAQRRAAQKLATKLATEAKEKKAEAVNALLVASEFGPVAAVLSVREGWDGHNGVPLALEFMVTETELTYTERVREVFDTMDVDHSGSLDRDEIAQLVESMAGDLLSEEDLDGALAPMDLDGDGTVDFSEFYDWWVLMNGTTKSEEFAVDPASPENTRLGAPLPLMEPSAGSPGSPPLVGMRRFFIKGSFKKKKDEPGEAYALSAASVPPPPNKPLRSFSDDVVRRLFDKTDTDGSGTLDRAEISSLVNSLGVWDSMWDSEEEKTEILDIIMREWDPDEDGRVEFSEFCAWYRALVKDQEDAVDPGSAMQGLLLSLSPKKRREKKDATAEDDRQEVRIVFASIDADGSGALDEGEFRQLTRELGNAEELTQKQLEEAMREMDADGNGEVNFDEFYEWWLRRLAGGESKSGVFKGGKGALRGLIGRLSKSSALALTLPAPERPATPPSPLYTNRNGLSALNDV